MASHAANPFAEPVGGPLCRIYFSCRDQGRRSSVGSLVLNLDTFSILDVAREPVLRPGEAGTFDDSGISLGCVVRTGRKRYLYYVGWNLAITVPFRNSIGLAISEDDKDFVKYAPAPILDRSRVDPLSLSYPWVLKQGPVWKMWYGSTQRWRSRDQEHVIKYAESTDGIQWETTGHICIDVLSEAAYAFSRPCVIVENELYKMWFSYRGQRYRIGYAESADGTTWKVLDDEQGLAGAGEGWESNSVEYPHVFDHAGKRYLLYCGNGYGQTGFGLAVWE